MKLRTQLFLLVSGTVIPLLALAAVLAYVLLQHESETFRDGARDRNRAFMTAVDAELRGHIKTLEALATSVNLERDDLRAFYDEATRVLAAQPGWSQVILSDARGRQVLNTRLPFGSALPGNVENTSWQTVVQTGAPAVGLITRGPLGSWGVPVRVPVKQQGTVRYVLSAPLRPEAFDRLIEEQRFPASWAAGLLDASGRFVARSPSRAPGERGSPDFLAAASHASEGWYRGRTLEGVDTYTAHRTSAWSGWTVGVAIPSSELFASAYRTAVALLASGLLSIALAIAFAWWMGRRVATPIAALAARARALPDARDALALPDSDIDEVREVGRALGEAGAAIRERETLHQREEIALKAADKAKDEFLAMLGHELRNPLSAITASAYVLRLSKPGDSTAAHAHGIIERQTRHMTRLIEDLLDVSRLARGKVSMRLERLDLAELARRVAQTWQAAGRRTPRNLLLHLTSAWIEADRSRMEQVITNLLDNADKFSPPSTAIEVSAGPVDGQAVLSVRDEGEGIDAAMFEHIFDAFAQGPQDPSRSQGGMGLGLTLVRRLVEAHGGRVEVASAGRGKGACFTVRLPRVEAPPTAHAPAVRADSTLDPQRIALIEDNDDGRAMLEAMLGLDGHEVRSALNGQAGVELVTTWRPDIAIVDIGLPDIDGHEVARRVRSAGVDTRLVALSGYGLPDDVQRAAAAGFDLHLTKPVPADALRRALASLRAPSPSYADR